MRDTRKPYKMLVGKAEEKRPLWRHRHRLENDIATDLI